MSGAELVIVGAGPAGLTAALESAKSGVEVVLIDENERPGGQLFKQIHKFFGSEEHQAGRRGYEIGYELLDKCKEAGVKIMLNTTVWGIFNKNTLGLVTQNKTKILQAKNIILATGASENPLAFPGWTLPGVMGAGAAQTMINIHRVLPGRRILMVGSGNVGLIVTYQLLQAGAKVVAVLEAMPKVGGYQVHASKIRRAGVPILTSCTVVEAKGADSVDEAIICSLDSQGKNIKHTEKKLKIDLICLAVGLSPLAELCWMAGCKFKYLSALGGHIPVHDEYMQTSIDGLYVAGDLAGVEEASTAMEEGRLAGVAVAHSLGYITKQEMEERKKVIWDSLQFLRTGPFGEMRQKAKNELIKKWSK
ncbi:MAG: NAD(P)/FAD-dependent oxidoreductase [Elusimicrobia bacterium]|nr:NAD(P)/FAD-dependent oxidoreductase [Elusimicrobiota bacterium]MBU2614451.1 NAD(P)/FAD-dependent oxidoreductase [Elusimicrobiota bacterium]